MKKIVITFLSLFTMIFIMCTTVFASDIQPPTLDASQYDSYIVYSYVNSNDYKSYYECVVYKSSDWTPYIDGKYIKWTCHVESPHVRYTSTSNSIDSYDATGYNGGWGMMEQYDKEMDGSEGIIYASNRNIYDDEGKLFFQGLQLQKVVNQSLTQTLIPKVAGAMKILVVCGISCLALLVVLSLFGKVFYRFRVR